MGLRKTQKELNEAYLYYMENLSCTQKDIQEKFNISDSVFRNYIKKNNLKTKKKWQYNSDYFQKINSLEKAYWLGFIMADGCIIDQNLNDNKSTSCSLRIRLSEIDKSHLEKLKNAMEYNKPISIVKNYGIYENAKNLAEFEVFSKKIVYDLYNLGLNFSNKSGNEKPIKFDNDEYTKNFILGLVDGDGSFTKSINNRFEFNLTSSEELLTFISNFLNSKLNLSSTRITNEHRTTKVKRLRIFGKNNVKLVLDYLYKDAPVVLDRKYTKYKQLFL